MSGDEVGTSTRPKSGTGRGHAPKSGASAPDPEPPARPLSAPARRLLEAADDLFYRQGAAATTVREITAACGLSPGALYNHFASKEELLYKLVQSRHRLVEEEVAQAQAAVAGDPAAELAAIVTVFVRVHFESEVGARVANREYRHLSGRRLHEVVAIRRRLRDRLIDVLAEGQRRGLFEICGGGDHASLLITGATILDMCIHSSEWLRRDGPLGIAELEDRFVELGLRLAGYDGARNPDGRPPPQPR